MASYWLVKTEPETYSFADLQRDKKTTWDGVRNFQARNNLGLMKIGDLVLVYHSVSDKALVGEAKVSKEAFVDASAKETGWLAVELAAPKSFKRPVTLAEIKKEPQLQNIGLLKQSRLSVMPLSADEYAKLKEMSGE